MKTEDKELLLRDLSGRLLYGVKVKVLIEKVVYDAVVHGVYADETVFVEQSPEPNKVHRIDVVHVSDVKPYLFPLSSLSRDQNEILIKEYHFSFNSCSDGITNGIYSPTFNRTIYYSVDEDDISKIIDWLNKNHIDYRGLIPMGLAIDATGLNIYKEG